MRLVMSTDAVVQHLRTPADDNTKVDRIRSSTIQLFNSSLVVEHVKVSRKYLQFLS